MSGGVDERGEQLATNQRVCGRRGLRAKMQAAAQENFWGCSLQTTSLTRGSRDADASTRLSTSENSTDLGLDISKI